MSGVRTCLSPPITLPVIATSLDVVHMPCDPPLTSPEMSPVMGVSSSNTNGYILLDRASALTVGNPSQVGNTCLYHL